MYFSPETFKGQYALVTGGGSGIGYGVARELLKLGATVYIGSRKAERIAAAVESLKTFGDCRGLVFDIRQIEQVEAAAAQIERLDLLINNAGGQFPGPALGFSPNGWFSVINNNLNGTFYVTQTMAKKFFVPQKKGVVVSIIANIYRGFPGMAHTGAARAGVDNLTKSLAVEWAPLNIRVNAVAPGIIDSSGLDQYPDDLRKMIDDSIPVRRRGTVEEVVWPTLFLASEMSAYITGATLNVDGAQSLWGSMWQIP